MAKSLKKSSTSGNDLSKESSTSGNDLLYEIIFMIFLRLPIKSLLQMKLVCSLWRSVVSDPYFIKAHLDIANDVHNLNLRRYISDSPKEKSIGLKNWDMRSERTIPPTNFSCNVEFLGSCNGLLLLGDYDRIYFLWNPSTGLLRSLNGPFLFRGEFRNFGFGYDSTSSAYKIVRIVRVASHKVGFRPPEHNRYCYDVTTAQVYNCKNYHWKKIEDFPFVIFENAQGVTMNGFPHWVMFRNHHGKDNAIDLAIVYFDLAEEKFKEIPKPDWLVHTSIYEFGAFEGKLCFIHYTKQIYEVWVMQKHGQESWINISSVPNVASVRLPGWSSGRRVEHDEGPDTFARAQYVESLVSPHGGSDMIG